MYKKWYALEKTTYNVYKKKKFFEVKNKIAKHLNRNFDKKQTD